MKTRKLEAKNLVLSAVAIAAMSMGFSTSASAQHVVASEVAARALTNVIAGSAGSRVATLMGNEASAAAVARAMNIKGMSGLTASQRVAEVTKAIEANKNDMAFIQRSARALGVEAEAATEYNKLYAALPQSQKSALSTASNAQAKAGTNVQASQSSSHVEYLRRVENSFVELSSNVSDMALLEEARSVALARGNEGILGDGWLTACKNMAAQPRATFLKAFGAIRTAGTNVVQQTQAFATALAEDLKITVDDALNRTCQLASKCNFVPKFAPVACAR